MNDVRDVRAVLGRLCERFEAAGIADPAADAELIVGHVLGVSRGRVQALDVMGAELSPEQLDAVHGLSEERARRVPLQHLTGRAPFRQLELSVGPGVFVPRPETETVVQFGIDELRALPDAEPIAVDLCTGSGAIALAIAHEVPAARVWAVEKSAEAHAWAERNVREWGAGRVALLRGDVTELDRGGRAADAGSRDGDPGSASSIGAAFEPLQGRVAVLVSNPPYVPRDMVPRDPEVRDHDPALALYSGADGLDLIRVISRIALRLVRPGGLLVLEHAEMQGAAIRALLTADGWAGAETRPDLTGRDRATLARR
ncbi:peptide chain release factor N(5)-glutamine methyltransferase [Leucobacter chironomi]|uniref:peptide chain release factor N(5)-glutamine methyltransferase n=1 Tax=Leucobacter chironomi TaxID=491918 RepID=UPI00041841CC|nr:peptide chain release factor N(5)-glutamine methyltransferase [Leucobacter chironomi]